MRRKFWSAHSTLSLQKKEENMRIAKAMACHHKVMSIQKKELQRNKKLFFRQRFCAALSFSKESVIGNRSISADMLHNQTCPKKGITYVGLEKISFPLTLFCERNVIEKGCKALSAKKQTIEDTDTLKK